jgi:hypothetical protein
VSTIVITAYTILAHIPSHLQPSPTRSLSPYTSNADLGYLLAHFHLGPSQPRPRHRGSATSPPFASPLTRVTRPRHHLPPTLRRGSACRGLATTSWRCRKEAIGVHRCPTWLPSTYVRAVRRWLGRMMCAASFYFVLWKCVQCFCWLRTAMYFIWILIVEVVNFL